MKVLHILPDHDLGGGGIVTARLLHALRDRNGPETHIAVLPENATAPMREIFADLPHVFGAYPGRGAPWKMARAILKLAAPGDVAHGQGTRAALGAMIAGALRPSLRTAYTVHGFHGVAQPGPLGIRVKLERLLALRMDATIFVSEADAALSEKTGLKRRGLAQVIENGFAVPAVAPDAPKDVDVMFVGRMVYQKWPEAMVETLALLPGAPKITVIGTGELSGAVDAMLAEKGVTAERHDGLPSAETLAQLARARVVVMTSRWEGLPTVAIEAAQSRAAVAGFDIPPLAEVLGESAPALLTPPDPAALAALIGGLLADEPRRAELAGALHDRARAQYSAARMAERYATVYRRIAAPR